MSKKFIIDTNVLLIDHQSIFRFEENTVIIPAIVLEELDNHKSGLNSGTAYNARRIAKYLDKLSKRGKLSEGVTLDNGGTLIVEDTVLEDNYGLDLKKNDNIIILHALLYKDGIGDEEVILVSNDCNVRLKARAKDLVAEGYEPSEVRNIDKNFKGHTELKTNSPVFEDMKKHLHDNQYVKVGKTLSRYVASKNALEKIKYYPDLPVKAKNDEQSFVLDALMNPDIKLVSITGKAGTGKTLLASAAGLVQVLNSKYRKLTIARPIMPMGKDLGFLPGTKEEKLKPWLQPIFDNIEYMLESNANDAGAYSIEDMQEKGLIELEALTYIRGRSFLNQFLIIDEAQNLTAHEMKTIITRAGEGTKIILTGDVEQIDSPFLDQHNNGLTLIIDKFKDSAIVAHIHLEKGERSELAELAADTL